MIWTFYTEDNGGKFSDGSDPGWPRGEWVRALARHYREKPHLLLCPEATLRRSRAGVAERPVPITTPEAQLAEYGGARTAYNFPNFAEDFSTSTLLIASYGANNWIYNARSAIQGRPAEDHWRSFAVSGQPTEIPLFLDSMWRGGGPDHRNIIKDAAPGSKSEWLGVEGESAHFALARHNRGINLVFFDQSVRSTTSPRKIWTFQWHRTYQRAGLERTKAFPAWMR